MTPLTLTLALIAAAPLSEVKQASGLSPEDWVLLEKNQPVVRVRTERTEGSVRGNAEGAIVIHRPLRECFEEVERYEGLSRYLPGLSESRVLERTSEGFRARAATRVLWLNYGYGLLFTSDRKKQELRWTLDRSQKADIADTRGAWRFLPVDETTTLLLYSVSVDTGSALPQSVQNFFTGRALPNLLTSFRDHLETSRGG